MASKYGNNNGNGHKPSQEPRKAEGDYRGRATRRTTPTEDTKNPVQELFSEGYRPATNWVAKTDASSEVRFDGSSRGIGGK